MRKIFSWGAGLASVVLAAIVTFPANAVVGGTPASTAGPSVGVETPSASCSGTLINSRWVLSAWHCIAAADAIGMIQWGNATRAQAQQTPFSLAVHQNDLALVRLDTELPPNAVAFPPLGDADPPVDAVVQFFGFGQDESGQSSPVLRTGSAVVVPPGNNGLGDVFGGPSWTTRANGNGTTVPGDSGGGAFLDGKLIGVTSAGDAEEANFASIAAHRAFIDSTIIG